MPEPPQPIVARGLGVDRNIDRRAIRARVVAPPSTPECPVQMRSAGRCRTRRRSTAAGGRCCFSWPWRKQYLDARGLYRVFNAAEYRFYRSSIGPPAEGSTPLAVGESLPFTPDDTFSDGTWYLSLSYFNGVLDSGFLPLGPAGETYLLLTIADGASVGQAPAAPLDWRLEALAGGGVRVVGVYYSGQWAAAAGQWAIAYSVDGSEPAVNDPDVTVDFSAGGLSMLSHELPAAANGTLVKVRLQIRRNDGTDAEPAWSYSTGSTVLTIAADAVGPSAPIAADGWPGPLPVDEGF